MTYNNIDKIKFTLSVSSNISSNNMEILQSKSFFEKIEKLKHKIYDINFTCRIPPFATDAMGINLNPEESALHLDQLLNLQRKTGIPVSPVFNNIYVPNTYQHLEIFVENFKTLYEQGIRSVTIPHILWMKFGLLRKAFPDLIIKNTVLRNVRSGQDFWNYAEAGFDYVNVDRVLLRDLSRLKEIKAAQQKFFEKTGKSVKTSLLTFEGCLGNCPLWDEHYQHTMTHPDINSIQNNEIFDIPKKYSCKKTGPNEYTTFNTVGLGVFKEDIDELCGYFDIVKIGGRKSFLSIFEELRYVSDIIDDDDDIVPLGTHRALIEQSMKNPRAVDKWRKVIKNCRFQCWQCSACSELIGDMAFHA